MGDTTKKISVNGTTSAYHPTTQDQINIALLQNGGIQRIQHAFHQRLDEAGWTQAVREYVEKLFRSGDAATYDEAVRAVMARVVLQPGEGVGGGPDLGIPLEVAKDGAGVVRKELEKVVRLEK